MRILEPMWREVTEKLHYEKMCNCIYDHNKEYEAGGDRKYV
jgi:hypothetical protein